MGRTDEEQEFPPTHEGSGSSGKLPGTAVSVTGPQRRASNHRTQGSHTSMELRGRAHQPISQELPLRTLSLHHLPGLPKPLRVPSGACNLGYMRDEVIVQLRSRRLHPSGQNFLGFTTVCSLSNQKQRRHLGTCSRRPILGSTPDLWIWDPGGGAQRLLC